MKKQSIFYPLMFGIAFIVLGIAVKQYILSVVFGIGFIIIFVILCINYNKEKKIAKKAEEYRQISHTLKYIVELEKTPENSRSIYIGTSDNQPYEVLSKHAEVGTKKVTVYEKTPRKITFDEFVKLVDEKYPGISVLYEGINENNWKSYLDAIVFWNKIPDEKKPLTKEFLDSFSNKYVFKSQNLLVKTQYYIPALVAISECFIEKGFVFKEAFAGGGVDEITHTGDKSYSAKYTDFDDFRNNFESDFKNTEKTEISRYGGWVSSLNYGFIDVRLIKDGVSVNITAIGNLFRVTWGETSENIESLKKETNDMILNTLGGNFYLEKYTY